MIAKGSVLKAEPLRLSNVKFHFKLEKDFDVKKNISVDDFTSIHENFAVARFENGAVYSVFRNHINVTGVKRFRDIPRTIRAFENQYAVNRIGEYKIDNCTYSGNLLHYRNLDRALLTKNLGLNIGKISDLIRSNRFFIRHRPDSFPGAVIRFPSRGTVILFASGKLVILGVSSENQANNVYSWLCVLTSR